MLLLQPSFASSATSTSYEILKKLWVVWPAISGQPPYENPQIITVLFEVTPARPVTSDWPDCLYNYSFRSDKTLSIKLPERTGGCSRFSRQLCDPLPANHCALKLSNGSTFMLPGLFPCYSLLLQYLIVFFFLSLVKYLFAFTQHILFTLFFFFLFFLIY